LDENIKEVVSEQFEFQRGKLEKLNASLKEKQSTVTMLLNLRENVDELYGLKSNK